jgi:hypothetical protein
MKCYVASERVARIVLQLRIRCVGQCAGWCYTPCDLGLSTVFPVAIPFSGDIVYNNHHVAGKDMCVGFLLSVVEAE